MKQLMLYPTTPTRIKRAARRAWLWAWSREWFAMLFFLVVVLGVLIATVEAESNPLLECFERTGDAVGCSYMMQNRRNLGLVD